MEIKLIPCNNPYCENVELEKDLTHSIHYGYPVCPECLRNIEGEYSVKK